MENKVMIFLAAQNCAGKTFIAKKLVEELHARHYSVREVIQEEARIRGVDISSREKFTKFSETRKQIWGSHVFLKKTINDFYKKRNERIAVVESVRCPGEVMYLKEKKLDMHILPIGIISDTETRLSRFLARSSSENLASVATVAEFNAQEKLVNSGTLPWQENVSKVLDLINFKFHSSDHFGKKIKELILKAEQENNKAH